MRPTIETQPTSAFAAQPFNWIAGRIQSDN